MSYEFHTDMVTYMTIQSVSEKKNAQVNADCKITTDPILILFSDFCSSELEFYVAPLSVCVCVCMFAISS